jgi:hypothetical protein
MVVVARRGVDVAEQDGILDADVREFMSGVQ